MTKQFKIGEYAVGGIIKVSKIKIKDEHFTDHVMIEALDYTTKKVVVSSRFFDWGDEAMSNFLNELTSSYYADKILDFIKNKLN
jgi:hypothetical protein